MSPSRVRAWLGLAVLAVLILPSAAQAAGFAGAEKVVRKPGGGPVRFVGTAPGHPLARPAGVSAATAPGAAGKAFLDAHRADFGLGRGAAVRATRTSAQPRGATAVRYQQSIDGVDVLGGEFVVQLDSQNRVKSVQGEAVTTRPSVTPNVAVDQAERAAIARVAREERVHAARLKATSSLRIFDDHVLGGPSARAAALAWAVEVGDGLAVRRLVVVDAERGTIRASIQRNPDAKNRSVCDGANNPAGAQVPCTTVVLDEDQNPPYTGPAADVQPAFDFSGDTYDFYAGHFGRDSLDDQGLALKSTVRYCDPNESCPFANAFWNGSQMVYGDTYASADDVVGHELSHGFTEFTSGLFYYYQSGAINESMSDVFGELVDQETASADDDPGDKWLMGESLPIGAIRNMADPTTFSDPDSMVSANYFTSFQDQGGVHSNSGVNNKAAFLMTDGGTFGVHTVTGLGIDKVAQIYYAVETGFLTSGSDYKDLGLSLVQACLNLTGTAGIVAADCDEVGEAVLATGMLTDRPENADMPECPVGQQAIYAIAEDIEGPLQNLPWSVLGDAVWGVAGFYATSGTQSLYGFDVDVQADGSVLTASATSVPTGAFLRFSHAFDLDRDDFGVYDGGVVEASTNGGSTWTDIVPAATYTGTVDDNFGNPLGGRAAFVGVSNGYHTTVVPLASLASTSALFRFRLGTDGVAKIIGDGWYVDDVAVGRCGTPGVPEASTGGATGITLAGAALAGTVNPHFLQTRYHFEYGIGSGLGTSTPEVTLAADDKVVPASATLSGLTAGTLYSYRLVAENERGRTDGPTLTFTTAANPPPATTGPTTTTPGGTTVTPAIVPSFPAGVKGTAKALKKGVKAAKITCVNKSATLASCKITFPGAKRKKKVSAKLTLGGAVVAKGAIKKADGKGTIQIVGSKPLKPGAYQLSIKVGSKTFKFKVKLV